MYLWISWYNIDVVSSVSFFGLTVGSVLPPYSWELASVLRDTKERFDSAGVKLIAIGVGTPAKARILAERVCICLSS